MKLWEPKRIKQVNKSECLNLQIFIFKNTTVFVMKEREKKKEKKKEKGTKLILMTQPNQKELHISVRWIYYWLATKGKRSRISALIKQGYLFCTE